MPSLQRFFSPTRNKRALAIVAVFFLLSADPRPGFGMSTLKTWVNKVRPGTFPELETNKGPAKTSTADTTGQEDISTTERGLLMSLMERKKQLDERETLLNQREEQLRALRDNVQTQLTELKKLQGEIEASMEAKKALDEQNLKKVVNLYDKMDPKKSAQKLAQLDTKVAAKILMAMNQRKASALLGELPPEKARSITEEIVRKTPEGN